MALIDVSALLLDPDFCDTVTVIRLVESVGDDGLVVMTEQQIDIIASIQSLTGEELALMPDLARAEGAMEILTTFPLAIATNGTNPRLISRRLRTSTIWSIRQLTSKTSAA